MTYCKNKTCCPDDLVFIRENNHRHTSINNGNENFDVVCLYKVEIVDKAENADDEESYSSLNKSAVDTNKEKTDASDDLLFSSNSFFFLRRFEGIKYYQGDRE